MPNASEIQDVQAAHPIAVVAARTGLSRDVIRVWERRYGAVAPSRSAGRQRLYTDADIRRFGLLAAATRYGRNISLIATLPDDALERLMADDAAAQPAAAASQAPAVTRALDGALDAIAALDAQALDAHLRRVTAREGTPWFLDTFVPGRAVVPFHPLPPNATFAPLRDEASELLPQVAVEDITARGCLPPAPLPAPHPLGDPLDDVTRVRVDRDVRLVLGQMLQGSDRATELHPVVGGAGLGDPVVPAFPAVSRPILEEPGGSTGAVPILELVPQAGLVGVHVHEGEATHRSGRYPNGGRTPLVVPSRGANFSTP